MRKQIIEVLISLRTLLREKFHQYNDKLPFFLMILLAFIIIVGGINLFVDLSNTLHTDVLAKYDSKVTEFVISFRTPPLNKVFQFITEIGDFKGYIIITIITTIIFFLKFRNWRFVLEIIFVQVIAGLANVALKQVINRARPDAEHLVSVATLSYPSGHAMSAMAFYGFLIYLFYNFKLNVWIKILTILILGLLILAIGISRIYLGVHYPSDIAGGYIAGFIWVIFCIVLFNVVDLLRKRRKKRSSKAQ
ncbi:phosphatase PAP2 family protein [Antarcticibacterium flavum]|uniref:Phosphatase PAP2 family protein n=1 Tax=Antarcticibacterium flavum TaxID=2058175 RepID=A0A5B7WYE8_9FLAO|nr:MULTISPECIES: phosphatase PAP2 family protein [Antarcticibacterium]MCM4158942.1 phosphatidic acid phosphatase [Antarcticibacterium sp. W02-3]QCY68196.1 phosphatase PAP2 family protein [Antarcticibacterium flavum]